MFEVKIIKEVDFSTSEEFEKNITFFINKDYTIKEFNTVIVSDRFSTSVALLIKEDKKDKKVRI